MMRRARISVKPNFRPANREASVGEQSSQAVKESGDTLQTSPAAKAVSLAPTNQQNTSTEESVQDGGVKIDPSLPSENSSANLNDSTPSSGTTVPVAAPHRRMRISAAPKLAGPKVTSTPRTFTRVASSAPSAKSSKKIEESQGSASTTQTPISIISGNEHDSLAPESTSTKLSTEPSTAHPPSSPCLPSTSGLQKPTVCVKKSTDSQSPSKPGKIPQQCLQNPEPETCSTSVILKRSDDIDSPEPTGKSSDKDRILRALKLKELMKIERRKDIKKGKKRVAYKEYTAVDRSKMTMRDLIYYLPNTSPLRFSEDRAEDQTETIVPPSPTMAIKKPEEEEAAESEDEVLVPKVRVAEDGSIILDEDSLTVRVKRSSNTTVVENSAALFERGSTTTYSSFREWNYVKSWSVRETDMFFLALSMVGIDFTLIGHLLTHRNRAAIKSKFKREERENSWRIDKALRNKRPFDREFFAFLLEKVLAKDKKGKSVKLVMTKPKKEKKGKGKVAKASEQDVYMEDSGCVDAEKENEDLSNVNKTPKSAPAKKKHKRKKEQLEDVDVEEETGKQGVIKKRRKYSKKTPKEKPLSIDDAEDESGLLNLETEEEQSRASEPKRKRRHAKKAEEEKQDEMPDPVEGNKSKRRRKTLKVSQDHANSISAHEESSSGCVDLEVATKCTHKGDLNPVTEESNTIKCTVQDKEVAEDHEEKEKTEAVEMLPQKAARRLKKPLPKLPRGRRKKITDAPADVEMQENELVNENTSVLTVSDDSLEDDRLQQQALIVLERTPPRVKTALSPCKALGKKKEPKSSVDPQASPASPYHQTRIQRADKVKRGRGMMDEADPGTSAVVQRSPTVLLERVILPESEHSESDNPLDENIMDLSCLSDFDSKMCLRRPMVALSREEVDGILNSQDEGDEDEPSLSPLDLSLNTELSFQHPCSSLMLDNAEVSQLESVEENEERPLGGDSHRVAHKERQNEDQEVTAALVQHDTSNPKDLSKSFHSEAREISKVEISGPMQEHETQVLLQTDRELTAANLFEAQIPLVVQADAASVDVKQHPIDNEMATTVIPEDTSSKASLTCLGVTRKPKKTLLATQIKDSLQESGRTSSEVVHQSVMVTPKHKERSQETVMKIPKIKEGLQRSLVASPKMNERKQKSVMMKPISKEGSQASVIVIPEIKKGSQESEMMRPIIKEGSQESVMAIPEMKKESQESVIATLESKEGLQESVMVSPKMIEESQEFVRLTPDIMEGSQESVIVTLETMNESQESVMLPTEMKKGSQESVMAMPEIKEGSRESIMVTQEINGFIESVKMKEGSEASEASAMPTLEIKEGSQESEMMKPILKERSQESVIATPDTMYVSQETVKKIPKIKEGSQRSLVASPKMNDVKQESVMMMKPISKEGSQESVIATPDTMYVSQEPVIMIPEIKKGSQESEMMKPIIKEESQQSVMAMPEIKEGSQESEMVMSEIKEGSQESEIIKPIINQGSQKSVMVMPEIKEDSQESMMVSFEIKAGSQESVMATSDMEKEGLMESRMVTPEIKEGTQESAIVILEPMNESQESVMLPPEMKKGSQEPVIVIPEIKKGSQESEMMKPVIKEGSRESVMVIREIKAGSQESVMVTPGMQKEGLTESGLATLKIKEGSQKSVIVAPDIMEGPQESVTASSETERSHRCVMATQVIKEGSQESVVPIQEMKKGFQESVTVTPEMKERSQKSLQETLEIKELLQKTPETSQRLKESREPTSKLKTGLLGSTKATSEVKEISVKHTPEVAPIVKNISLEKADLPSSSASAPSEHETSIKRRSRFIKPKPNLTSRAAGLQNKRQTLPVKASMADLAVGSEKDVQTGDFSKESSSKKEDMVVDPMETDPAKVLGGRTKVLEQELITSLTLSADEANTASEQPDSLCDVHMTPSCEPDLSKVETACPLPIQAIEHEKDSCAPAEIINSTQDGHNDEEPIFILTLYEIPVTEAYPACNHKEATYNLQAQYPLLFPDQVPVVPSMSESTRSFMGNTMYVESENTEPAMEQTSASLRTVDLQTTDEPHEESGDMKTKNHSTKAKSECKENSDLVHLEELQPSIDSLAQDSEEPTQCQDMLHTVLPDIFIHPLEEIEDHLSKQCSVTVECTSKDKCSSTLEERPDTTHEEPTKVKLKRESIIAATKSEAAHTSSPESELSKNPKHDQACSENSARNVSAFKQDMTSEDKRSCGSLTVDPEDIKTNCEGVSHVLLADVFVPVSEDPIDVSHDWCVARGSHRGTTTPKTKEVPIKKVFENRDISESSTEEAKLIPSLKCKTLSRRRGKKRTKRARTNNDSPSPQLNTFAQNEDSFNDPAKMEKKEISDVNPSEEAKDMENLEPTLQRKHCIIPCAVSHSRCTDSLPEDWEENANVSQKQVKEAASSAFTSTEELKEPSEMEAVKSGKKSSVRKKGKQTGRKIKPLEMKTPDVEHLPLTRTVPQTRQLNITAWAKKKSLQTKTKLDETVEVSQVMPLSNAEESSPQDSVASEDQSVLPNEKSLSCSKSKNEDLKETLGFSCSVPALEDAEEACSSHQVKTSAENVKESSEETSVPQMKKPSASLKAKHQAKSRWSKRMSASKSDQEKPTQLTLPTRHSASTTKVKKKSEEAVKKSTQDTSRTETNSESKDGTLLSRVPPSPKSRDLWPKLILPRVNLSTTECGSDSSASTASPARVSRTATTTRLKKSPIVIRGSSSVSEDTDYDPSRVSQFTLCDIFTEVDDTE